MERLCISSLVVQAQPCLINDIRSQIEAHPEAEVMGDSEQGKMVVVLDTTNNRRAADMIADIQKFEGVLSATLIYQYDDPIEPQMEDSV